MPASSLPHPVQPTRFVTPLRVFLLACAGGLLGLRLLGWTPFWTLLRVPSFSPPFGDMRSVQAAPTAVDKGLDPQLQNDANASRPWLAKMNYPRIWISVSRGLGLENESHFLLFCGLLGLGYLASCAWLLRRQPSWLLLLAALSPASMLAVERGNNDLAVFLLLGFAAAAVELPALAAAGLLAAVLAKVYPLVAAPAFLRRQDRSVNAALLLGLALAFASLLPQLPAIRAGNAAADTLYWTYGLPVLGNAVARWSGLTVPAATAAVLLVLGLASAWTARRLPSLAGPRRQSVLLFEIGASIFVFSFLLAPNWDYRLIFLVPCFPFLTQLRQRRLGLGTALAIVVAMQSSGLPSRSRVQVLEQGVKSALFVVLAAYLAQLWLKAPDGSVDEAD